VLFNDYIPDASQAVLAFAFAGAVAWLLVPVTETLARRIGAMDYPTERSLHDAPTPRLGGVAVLIAVLAAGVLFLPWDNETRAILGGALVIAVVGILDDIVDLNPALKLAGQTLAAAIPVSAGIGVQDFTLPFVGRVEPGDIGLPLVGAVNAGDLFTVIGIVAIVNVINFSDGVDGLAAGVCLISALSLAAVALSLDRYEAGVLAGITAGAALGFLRHGFPPASSFMGDTGSNLLGYLLATIAIQGSLKTNAVLALALPLIVLAVPILDTSFVIAKRLKHGQPIYRADSWHFHHRMANIGFSQRRTLAYLYGWTLIAAVIALALRFVPYSDDRGNLDPLWTIVMAVLILGALAASVYVVFTLEILKLRRFRMRQRLRGAKEPDEELEAEVDAEVERELDTGEFAAVDPDAEGSKAAVGNRDRTPQK
jgi:UDP-GlcNAc:undecaprenyl-phosphate/decaprenyl-phosphate GlcNAc-1-phosphate transferase